MQLPDALIQLYEKPDDVEKTQLVQQLREIEGVLTPRFSQEKANVLFASYNSDTVNAAALIEKPGENGLHSHLAGL